MIKIRKCPSLAGEVTAINGTQITLKLIELPTMPADKNGNSKDGQSTTQVQSKVHTRWTKTNGTQPTDNC